MAELVQLNNNKENVLEFELVTEGVNPEDIDAKFVIRSAEMDLSFPCTKDANGKWIVKLPALPMLERTAYPYYFSIVTEGYHFKPIQGEVHVVGSPDVYVTSVKTKLAAPVRSTPIRETKTIVGKEAVVNKSQPTRGREKGIAQIATELMESKKPAKVTEPKAPALAKSATTVVKEQPTKVEVVPAPIVESAPILANKIQVEPKQTGTKDAAVRSILQEIGVINAEPRKKFSVLDALNISKG